MTIDLLVIYTNRLDECRDFYAGLGLALVPERHGNGPDHYAATLADGTVLELYPATRRPETGYLRLGLPGDSSRTLTDPDGRTVVLTAPERSPVTTTRETVRRILGDTAQTDVRVHPGGDVSVSITIGDDFAVVDGKDATGWAWSLNPAPHEGFTGHDHTAKNIEEALQGVHAQIALGTP
ncbi:glyoxalase/bleomycin resistance/dioxygenase family protein [Streptomyces sp. NPDC047976]|uniref:VOC family protein n=1 Tax=Streptomyces sp. NPDC047976 TaxID=3155746 RepID=UPI0034347C1E